MTYRVICVDNTLHTIRVSELKSPYQRGGDGAQLHVCKMFTDAAMPSSTEWKVRAVRTLVDSPVAVVDLFASILVNSHIVSLVPAVGFPLQWVTEVIGGS